MTTGTTTPPGQQTRALLQQALDYMNRDDMTLAEAALTRVLAQAPAEPDALQLMGLVRRAQERFPEAEDFYRRSLAMRPEQPHVLNNLGNLLRGQGRNDDAIVAYREAVRLKPNYAEAHVNLGLTHHAKSDFEAAQKSYRQALRYQPNYLFAMQSLAAALNDLDKPKEAERVLRNALAIDSKNSRQVAALEHNLGVSLKLQQRYAEALPLLDDAQARVPDMPFVDYNRGNVFQHLGRHEDAIQAYRRALVVNPLDMNAHDDLNQLLYRLGRDDEFMQSYDEAAAVYPEADVLNLGRGDLLLKSGRFAEAKEAYESVALRVPSSALANYGLASALTKLGDYSAAIAAHERALKIFPDNATAHTNFALTLLASGDAKKALQQAEEALARAPADQYALAMLGTAYRMLDDGRDDALNDYENLVQVFEIAPPDDYSDTESFNRDLNAYLDRLHGDKREYLDQTLRGGTQTFDNVFGAGHAPVEALRARIDDAVMQYISRMKDDSAHPLFGRRAPGFAYAGSWSSRLHDCGFHTNHIHPKGWISSAYYVALPESVADESGKEGWIKFGEPSSDIAMKNSVRRTVQPKAGRLVLFPSYMWHGTIPFHSPNARTTIAFDVVPR